MKKFKKFFSKGKAAKLITLFLTVVLLGDVMGALPVHATSEENSSNEILKGTPVLDGQVDDIYLQSLTLHEGAGVEGAGGVNAYIAAGNANTDFWDNTVTIHFLCDTNYLYICANIKDDSVVSRGQQYVQKDSDGGPWMNDCCEFRLSLNGGVNTIKVGIDAFGFRCYGLTKDMENMDYSEILYETSVIESGENTGYVIEFAIPCSITYTDSSNGEVSTFDLVNTGKLGFKLQLNDFEYDSSFANFAAEYDGEGPKGLVYYDLSDDIKYIDYKELSFAQDGNYKLLGNGSDTNGSWVAGADAVTISYGSNVTEKATRYVIRPYFNTTTALGYYTADYKYMRVLYSATNPEGVESVDMKLRNDANGSWNTIASNITDTNGEFVLTNTYTMLDHMAERWATKGAHLSLMFNALTEGGSYSVKSIYLFKTAKDADAFVVPVAEAPDEETEALDYKKLSFLTGGNYVIYGSGSPSYGNWEVDEDTGVVAVLYGSGVTEKQTRYMIKPKFDTAGYYEKEYKYMRVLYSATNPEGVESVDMKLRNDGYGSFNTIASNITNTNGEFVLTNTYTMPDHMTERYENNLHMSFMFSTLEEGGRYLVNAFYFFKTQEDADNFDLASERKKIEINGVDISNYKIVIPEDGFGNEYDNAKCIMQGIYASCGVQIPIVYDSEAAGEYEILIGSTNRTETQSFYGTGGLFDLASEQYQYCVSQYHVRRVGNKVIFVSGVAEGIDTGVNTFANNIQNSEASVINVSEEIIDFGLLRYQLISWPKVTNVSDPIHFEDNFDSNDGYWTTDSDKQGWIFATEGENNILSSGNSSSALSYLHVFESNVTFEAKWKVATSESGQAGLMLRHTADAAYVKGGYDFTAGGWFIDSREGDDFMRYRLAFKESDISVDQWYDIKAVVDGTTAELYVDGVKILSTDNLTQLTPGKIGVFADNVSASLDDVDISLLSGQGTIMRNVVHTKLPGEEYHEGGSVWELEDGSLVYEHHTALTYVSNDSGKIWTNSPAWISNTHGYPNILRLQNGDFLHIVTKKVDGVTMWGSRTSSDEGKTWTNGGSICPQNTYIADGTIKINAGNMNDKITQMSNGRIFYVQTMNTSTAAAEYGYPRVWCDVYYSDDNGATWTKSESSTFEMSGNDVSIRIGEAKVLETANGILRLYSSWNDYGCIVYSESTDNGVTWGPIQYLEGYVCSKSSMQFAKDTYADNNTTYYMVWVKNDTTDDPEESQASMPRSHLVLEKSVDGINWTYLGDIWRWESKYYSNTADIQHIVDPFITVTEDYLIIGSGLSEKVGTAAHHAQREHIYSVRKDTLGNENAVIPVTGVALDKEQITLAPEEEYVLSATVSPGDR